MNENRSAPFVWPREGEFVVAETEGRLRGCVYRRGKFQDSWTNQTCQYQPIVWYHVGTEVPQREMRSP